MDDRISVIIPIYNVSEQDLRQCIDGVISQTYTALDILLIDDGSTNGSGKICDSYEKADSRIRVIHTDNRGVSHARNIGLTKAEGRYLTFIDADDVIDIHAFETAISKLEKYQTDCVVYGWTEEGNEPDNTILRKVTNQEKILDAQTASNIIIKDNYGCGGGYPWNKIWDKSKVYKDNNPILFDEDLFAYEDKYWILEVLLNCSKVLLLPNVLYTYKYNPAGLTKSTELWEARDLNGLDAYHKIVLLEADNPKAAVEAEKFLANNLIKFLYPAWISRASNIGHFQRLAKRYHLWREHIKFSRMCGVRNVCKYLILRAALWLYV